MGIFVSGLNGPQGLVFDNLGNLYCSDQIGNTISKITPGGAKTTFASGLNTPFGLAFDNSGNLYCANNSNDTISKITPNGTKSQFVASGLGLNSPFGLVCDNSGNLYCANLNGNSISKITPSGVVSPFATGLSAPRGIAIDNLGNVYFSNSNGKIFKITPAGGSNNVSTFVDGGLGTANYLEFDNSGNLYCSDFDGNVIRKITINGGSAPAVNTFINNGLNNPTGMAFDNLGNLYCSNFGGSTIVRTKQEPIITNFSIPTKTFGNSPFTITDPSSNSDGSFNYISSNTLVATISGKTLTIIGAGSSTITATQASTNNYNSGTITSNFQVDKSSPTITNFSIPTKTFGNSPFTITDPSSNSDGSFNYISSDTLVATISGNTITIVGAGSSTITATQAFTNNYTLGTITTSLTVLVVPTLTNFYTNGIVKTRLPDDPPFNFTLTDPSSNSDGSFNYTSSNGSVATVLGNIVTVYTDGSSNITANQSPYDIYGSGSISTNLLVSNICFIIGTLIKLDQGFISIEKINPDIHTINGKKIIAITQTISTYDFLICFEKHSLGNNIPSQKTIITHSHEIFFKGKMRKAIECMEFSENIYKIKYRGEVLYNVLMENHETMNVHNIICETLHPENPIAKLYYLLKTCLPEQQKRFVKKYNEYIIKNNNFSSNQLKHLKKCL
jgi:sugar lactone lactonase YvrE